MKTPTLLLATLLLATLLTGTLPLPAQTPSPTPTRTLVDITVEPESDTIHISPYIYGSNGQSDDRDERITARRQGGNRHTGYNWENNASNAGSDYIHHSDNYLTRDFTAAEQNMPGIVLTKFHEESLSIGAYSLVTLPAAGFVARDKHGTVEANQTAPSSRWREVVFRKPMAFDLVPDTTDNYVYVDEQVNFLVNRFGGAGAANGIKGYSIDNEPALWPSTHPRIHPEKTRAREVIEKSLAMARAVKDVDPEAEIFGGVFYGFSEFLNEQDAPDWSQYSSHGTFIDAFLAEMRRGAGGVRLLDVLDLHWYPEARGRDRNGTLVRIAFDTTADSGVAAARMQAPRSLWDSTYREDSWIGQYFSPVALLHSVNASIARNYPGTRLAITELNYGGENHISGAIAMADVLGILGEHNVYMSNYWGPINDFVSAAYRLYRNYDGEGAAFGNRALRSRTSNNELSAIHASLDAAGRLHLITINRGFSDSIEAHISLPLETGSRYQLRQAYLLTGESPVIRPWNGVTSIQGEVFTCTLPPLSVSHMILEQLPTSGVPAIDISEHFIAFSPFPDRSAGRLEYSLPRAGDVRVDMIDLTGRLVRRIADENRGSGLHTTTFPMDGIPAGFYLIRLQSASGVVVTRAIVR